MSILDKEGPCPKAIADKYDQLKPVPGYATIYGMCDACSYPQLLQSEAIPDVDKDAPGTLELVWLNSNTCAKCGEIANRYPEVFLWVRNVMETQVAQLRAERPIFISDLTQPMAPDQAQSAADMQTAITVTADPEAPAISTSESPGEPT